MLWLIAGLLVLGAVCGAVIRLMFFVGVLLGAAAIAIAVSAGAEGLGGALLNALISIVLLQLGYGIGVVLRAAIAARRRAGRVRTDRKQPVTSPLGGNANSRDNSTAAVRKR